MAYAKAGRILIADGSAPTTLKWHQTSAIRALDAKLEGRARFAGMLVMPTGSGKTVTAAYWLLKNIINRGGKVLWIAHRHELLVQALQTFHSLAYRDVTADIRAFQYRLISGLTEHDTAENINGFDDLIIASKDSFHDKGLNKLYFHWGKANKNAILVIDEAHHATAKTYRYIIDGMGRLVPNLKLLGLTATPIRTSDQERGFLKRIFPDDIVYKIDLKTLIAQGILAEPIFRETRTNYEVAREVSEPDLSRIRRFDLPTKLATRLALQKERNHLIVSEYFDRLAEDGTGYGQTIIFALNIEHAVTLNTLFNDRGKEPGIRSAVVVSNVREANQAQHRQHIEDFRAGRIQVLINVMILTEGVDLPQAESVFLTRPTISETLMTQMIGRVLRGPELGGTHSAYVVSFIDDWHDKITWVSPGFLYDFEAEFPDDTPEGRQWALRLISVAQIQEFARMLDQSVDTEGLERLPAIDRVPLGFYSFTLQNEKHCVVLVYSHLRQPYINMLRQLPYIFSEKRLDRRLSLSQADLTKLLPIMKNRYFADSGSKLLCRDDDLADLLCYYAEKNTIPPYLEFKDRGKFDISKVAGDILDRRLDAFTERDLLNELWEEPTAFWKLYYGNEKRYFLHALQLEKNKILFPEDYPIFRPPVIEAEADWPTSASLRSTKSKATKKKAKPNIGRGLKYLPNGTLCRMTYRRKQYIGKISNGLLVISPRRRYTSFTGASEGITRTSRRGWQDWEILLPGSATWIRADDWRK